MENINQQLAQEIDETGRKLTGAIAQFSDAQINLVPFTGSWTAAQVADHVLRSGAGVHELVYAPSLPCERPFDEKEASLRNLFLDMRTRMESPSEIWPAGSALNREQLLSSVQHLVSKLSEAASVLDLTGLCPGFEFPGEGLMTRYEWLRFFTFHTRRHTAQLNRIFFSMIPAANMRKIEKTIVVQAPAGRVWHALTDAANIKTWYSSFGEGLYAITDWQEGSKVLVTNDREMGMVGTIVRAVKDRELDLVFSGEYRNGEEIYDSEMAASVRGGHETYVLDEQQGITTLYVRVDMSGEYADMISKAWDKALAVIKKIAEAG